ncbi:FkbM family methyltransferase [Natrialba swarupiae]|uniref:FkbM family methyltransferase n=1 Tax=Natrialba swarupiae TaxID=2448032 RepID=A0A5D5AEP9_9EURY|nr:FkbM family methyltransferase [Natrialba swarupiae]TYT60259.1 FkbM family methyltransferase [Natrialba swarupiae]
MRSKVVVVFKNKSIKHIAYKNLLQLYYWLRLRLLFEPHIPPIGSMYIGGQKIGLGYRDKWINDMVTPDESDIVIEAGVYEGKDTAMYAKMAERVVGFEPSPRNYSKAKNNLKKFDNVDIYNNGLWYEKDTLQIKYGESGVDDGFLDPDIDSGERGEKIPVNTIESYVGEFNIPRVDFLKVEAEGAEPEILEGLGQLRPQKIAVDAGEERGGEPTGSEVLKLLQPMGYSLVGMNKGKRLFFTRDPVDHEALKDIVN